MKKNFWQKLQTLRQAQGKPFFVLAPMADVTDSAFRRIVAKYGKPDVLWTEFVACDGLMHKDGQKKLLHNFEYTEKERPIIAQVFGSNPENFEKTARLVKKLGFDGIDINMGCPERNIQKQGAGASLIKTPKLAREIILATKKGAGTMPVSVKTRIGYNKNELETWLPALLETEPSAITLHSRTKKEMSDVPADWTQIKRAVEIRDAMKVKTLIIGNGDVKTLDEARVRAGETGCDGVMIGRGIFGRPWLFAEKKEPSLEKRLAIMIEHTKLFEKLFKGVKNFAVMKKHFKAYVEGFPGAKELRMKLMEATNAKEVEKITKDFLLKK